MKDVVILLASKILNGILGLWLFQIIRHFLLPELYIDFSNCFAMLMLITTVSGGAISGLMLKKAFNSKTHKDIIQVWAVFFLLLSIFAIEGLILFNGIQSAFRLHTYIFVLAQFFMSVALVDYQIKHKFLLMSSIDLLRMLVPLITLLILHHLFKMNSLKVGAVLWVMISGNVFGIYYLIVAVGLKPEQIFNWQYFKINWKSDLLFSFWFAAFNGIAQSLIAADRNFISRNYNAIEGSKIAYTADQITKVINGMLFPINTKISSELGVLIRDKKTKEFYQLLNRSTLITFSIGILLLIIIISGTFLADRLGVSLGFDNFALVFYVLANTMYLSAIVFQKRFDYTLFKFLPSLMLIVASVLGYLIIKIFFKNVPLYFASTFTYFILILVCSFKTKKLKLSY